uniref:DH domain-containing protein n=1 Tax=Syphacia muris TaxID=451379 RepID=A0A158R4V6_9BILA
MRFPSKHFSDVEALLAGIAPHKFFQVHGIRCCQQPNCVFVEFCLCAALPFDAVPGLLCATHSIYSRSRPSCKLIIIVDAQDSTPDDVRSTVSALISFCFSCHNLVERVYWVGILLPEAVQASLSKDLSEYNVQNVFVESVPLLKEYLSADCYSTNLQGLISLGTAEQFFCMRCMLEQFMGKTHRIAKLYMNVHDELRRFMDTSNNKNPSTYENICAKEADLLERWRKLEKDSDRSSLMADGSKICAELLHKFPLLESCDPLLYKEAVKQAAKAFDEVMDVIKRSDATIKKKRRALEGARYAMEFLDYKKNVSLTLKVDVHEMERIVAIRTSSLSRLVAQLGRIRKIYERVCVNLSEAAEKATKMQQLFDEDFNITDLDPVALQKEVDDFISALSSVRLLVDKILETSLQTVEIRSSVDKVYDWVLLCAKKIDDASEFECLLKSFPAAAVKLLKQTYKKDGIDEMVSKEIGTLLNDVVSSMRKISGNPSWSFAVESDASEIYGNVVLDTEIIKEDVNSTKLPRKRSSLSVDSGVNNQQVSCSSASSTFDDHFCLPFKSTSLSSSFASLPSSVNYSTTSLISPNTDNFSDIGCSVEKIIRNKATVADVAKVSTVTKISLPQLFFNDGDSTLPCSKSPILNMDSSLSDNGCGKKVICNHSIDECTHVQSTSKSETFCDSYAPPLNVHCDSVESTVCNELLVANSVDDLSSSQEDKFDELCGRCSSPAPTQYEVPISKSSVSNSSMIDHNLMKDLDCETETEIRWRRNSWSSLSKVEEGLPTDERAIGGAPVTLDMTDKVITCMSSNTLIKRLGQRRSVSGFPTRLSNPFLINGVARPGSARYSSSHKTRLPFSRLFPLNSSEQDRFSIASSFQFPADDEVSSSEVVYSNIVPSYSAIDFSMRSEQIESIRSSLNPSKTSNANFRIECTVVRDLLDSEIDYVGSLRSVVQDFLPEMSRPDLPASLRGKKTLLFGNIEKLFHFHAHTFLPQLISRLRFRPTEESLSLTVGSLFVEHALSFNLYSLYAKNKPKADALMRESGIAFFSSLKASKDLANLLVRPIERVGKYTLALQQLLNAASPNKMEVLDILQKGVGVVGCQIRHGADLLAMERITGCDLNLREQGTLLRNDIMFVTEKHGLYAKKRLRSVFLFTNSVVITKPRLRRDHSGKSYDELRYKGSIQMTDCGLTEMVKTSKTKFELWFRKRTASFTYILETQSANVRDLWVSDIRTLLWKQAIKSREDSLLEKVSMGMDDPAASLLSLGSISTVLCNRDWNDTSRRPCSLISLTASSCSSSNNATLRGASAHGRGTGEVIAGDLDRVEEIDETELHNNKDYSSSLPRFNAPPPPVMSRFGVTTAEVLQ